MARSLDSDGQPPDDGRMDDRISKLEVRLAAVERDITVIRSNYVTKEDLHKEIAAQTWRLVTFVCGFGTALVAATYFIATHAHAG